MTRSRLVGALFVLLLVAGIGLAPQAGAGQTSQASVLTATPAEGVTVTLTSVSPRLPEADPSAQKVTFSAVVTNNTGTAYSDLQVRLDRGEPIGRQDKLDEAISTPPATDNLNLAPVDLKLALPAHGSAPVSYQSSPDCGHMCLWTNGVFPFALVVLGQQSPTSEISELGRAQVLVPSFPTAPAGVRVSWLWPLIDRPHRSLSGTVFTDDDLATSVATNGRLERALATAELATAAGSSMTLLIDPELLDSLAIMAAGYRIKLGNTTVVGTGGAVAAAWLARLAQLRLRPGVDISLTAYADPDAVAATRAGLDYSNVLDPQVQARLSSVLGTTTSNAVYWPAGGSLTPGALDAVVEAGAADIVLSDQSLPVKTASPELTPNGVAALATSSTQATALVTDTAIQKTIASAFSDPAGLPQDEQTLLAQLAVRAAYDPTNLHFVMMTPPDRYVDVDPRVAAELISISSMNAWTAPISVTNAVQTATPSIRGALVVLASGHAVTDRQLASLVELNARVSSLRQMFTNTDAVALLGDFGTAEQRAQSNGWLAAPGARTSLFSDLNRQVDNLSKAVHLVRPTNGTYSLSSRDSPIVVTAENTLDQAVTVWISVKPAKGILGFNADSVKATIPGHSKSTIQIASRVERIGRFTVSATMATRDGRVLGEPIPLTLRVTAIGGITKAITGLAGALVLLTLIRRLVRRLRRPAAATGPEPGPGR